MEDRDRVDILAAREDERVFENLVAKYKTFILYQAFRAVRHFVTTGDDEWSVALGAFSEAVTSWDSEKGPFRPFAALVIRRRLADYIQTEARHSPEISVEPQLLSGEYEDEDDASGARIRSTVYEVSGYADEGSTPGYSAARDEIDAVRKLIEPYGFTFEDLVSCSPKADKTRKSCAAAIATLIISEELFGAMRRDRQLPMKQLTESSGVDRRIIERHRRYIIAAAEIMKGDYPLIGSYLEAVKEYIEGMRESE